MYFKKFENEDGVLYYDPSSDEGLYFIAAVIRECVSPDESLFLFGHIPGAMLEQADLPALLLRACGAGEKLPKYIALTSECELFVGCQGTYQQCKRILDDTIKSAGPVQPCSDIQYLVGDATAPQGDGQKIIAHVCNDIDAWGSGFVVALSRRWEAPERRYRIWHDVGDGFQLGAVQFVPVEEDVSVANMIAQHGIRKSGQPQPPIRYPALEQCLRLVAQRALERGASVHMPRIGCGRAGGSWSEVEPIIRRCLTDVGVPVFVYDLPAGS